VLLAKLGPQGTIHPLLPTATMRLPAILTGRAMPLAPAAFKIQDI
jgi:hypothetical protein